MSSDNIEEKSVESPVAPSTKAHVVVIGVHDYILANVENLLQRDGYTTVGFLDMEQAMEYIRANKTDLVLVGGGVNPNDRIAVKNLLSAEFPQARFLEHFGGPATIIPEVEQSLR
ncbi:MAG: hypothetical protein RL220_292 [Bacteroidota bacterium]|jgi:hypothetical protein